MLDEENITQNVAPGGDEYYEETVVEYVDNRRRRTILVVALVLLVLLLSSVGYFAVRSMQPAGAPTASELPTGISWIRSLYSFGPSTDQALVSPTATAIGSDGTIWTLASKHYIVGFSPRGTVSRIIAPAIGRQMGQVTSLEGIAVGDDGSIYVSDFGNNAVDVFSPQGQFLRSWGVQLPVVLSVKGGRVAVAAANGIGVFDTQGKLINKWASRGSKKDQVNLPHGILIGADNNIYVSDTQNRRVKAYKPNGELMWMIGDLNRTGANLASTQTSVPVVNGIPQNFLLPSGMTQDGAGRLLIVDAFTFEVVVLDPTHQGRVVARYGTEGQQDGQFAYPTGISYDKDRDWIAVADTTNNRVQIMRIPGTGGSAVRRGLKSLTDTPIWLCSIPLLLLLLAVFLMRNNRRTEREDASSDDASVQTE